MNRISTKQNPPTEAAKARRQRKIKKLRCAILSIKPIGPNSCLVWGGEREHIVTLEEGVIKCDCKGWVTAHDHLCSHVMKYRLVYGDLKK